MENEKMKNGKKKRIFGCFVMAAALLGCAMLTGCSDDTTTSGGEINYKVTVNDPTGTPCTSGVVVSFYEGDTQVAMQPCGESGIAQKTLPAGEYTVKLQFTGEADAYHYEEGLTVTKEKPELEVTLMARPTGEGIVLSVRVDTDSDDIFAVERKDYTAYDITVGETYADVTPGDKTYFIFAPSMAGKYQISIAQGEGCSIAYYGSTSYVTQIPAVDVVEGVTTLTVKEDGINLGAETGTTVWVLGVESETLENCVISIVRAGDPDWTPSDEKWVIYETTAKLTQCTLPEGTQLKNFDLTAEGYTIVYNEADGYYHKDSKDGAIVYVYLTKDTRYIDCFQTILDNTPVRAYIYDNDGNFVRKEAYGTCLKEYFAYADTVNGVYPLTEDLKYIIQTYGDKSGWWNPTDGGYLFAEMSAGTGKGVNTEIAWLLMCCYAE